MNFRIPLMILVISSSWAMAQTLEGVTGVDTQSNFNQQFLARRHLDASSPQTKSGLDPRVVVFAGDRVVPHVVDGGSWQTSFFWVNLERMRLRFLQTSPTRNKLRPDFAKCGGSLAPSRFSSRMRAVRSAKG